MQPQIEYFVNNYPSRTGMTTHILDGDDHEGWWHQKLNMKPGLVLEALARQAGRNDLNYLGYMTRDVLIPSSNGCTRIRVNHPGGGSTQNISGKLQNVINSLGRGVHPDIFLMGHYHKKMYLEWRGVHGFFVPCTCDDTPFMQKKLIHNVKGALVVSFTQAPDGSVLELDPKFLPGGNLRQWEHL